MEMVFRPYMNGEAWLNTFDTYEEAESFIENFKHANRVPENAVFEIKQELKPGTPDEEEAN